MRRVGLSGAHRFGMMVALVAAVLQRPGMMTLLNLRTPLLGRFRKRLVTALAPSVARQRPKPGCLALLSAYDISCRALTCPLPLRPVDWGQSKQGVER